MTLGGNGGKKSEEFKKRQAKRMKGVGKNVPKPKGYCEELSKRKKIWWASLSDEERRRGPVSAETSKNISLGLTGKKRYFKQD